MKISLQIMKISLMILCMNLVLCILIFGVEGRSSQHNSGHIQSAPKQLKQNPAKLRGQKQQLQQQQKQIQKQQQQQQQQQQQEGGKQRIVESKSVVDFQQENVKFAGDVFGTYRGRWLKLQNGNFLSSARFVLGHFGVMVYQIRPKEHHRKFAKDKNVVEIEGDLILRQGQYITDYDLKLPFEGIYIPKTGKLHAIVQPNAKNPQTTNSTTDKIKTEEARKKAIRDGQTHVRQKISFASKVLQQCQFRIEMTAGELEDTLVLVQMPTVITDVVVDWGQLQKKNGKEKNQGKGVYMEGRFYSPNCYLDLLVNGRTFFLQQTNKQ
eukprot:TRINITY_DN19014_c0_g1_i5.p1 TRINITY_DN19014_c0_g1~~TRINITY_DN19014_c0_g1_i5.p1  ORF type:complete len:323 (-),score=42.76 TRINITY_DN19014_c0_g1_i5:106-1074(-)